MGSEENKGGLWGGYLWGGLDGPKIALQSCCDLLYSSCPALPQLRAGSNRCCRISHAVKQEIRSIAVASPNTQHAGQVVAIDSALKRKRGQANDVCNATTAKRFVRDGMWQYTYSSQKSWKHSGHMSFCLDGVRVDDDDLVSAIVYNTRQLVGNWSPPNVPQVKAVLRDFSHRNRAQFQT